MSPRGRTRPASMPYRFERDVVLAAEPAAVFDHLDDHRRLAAHMEQRSWRLGFGRLALNTSADATGRQVLVWRGRVLGLPIDVTEVVIERSPPHRKRWQTIGTPRLWVVGGYTMGFDVAVHVGGSQVRIDIEYTLPERGALHVVGRLIGHHYARWCVTRMIEDISGQFGANIRS